MKTIQFNKSQILSWAAQYKYVAFYDSCDNKKNDKYYSYDCLVAVSNTFVLLENAVNDADNCLFEKLDKLQTKSKNWLFGYLGYDLKNEVEKLVSKNKDALEFPDLFFFEPEIVLIKENGTWRIESKQDEISLEIIKQQISTCPPIETNLSPNNSPEIRNRLDYEAYQKKIKAIKADIENGIYYELNLCREFYAENATINVLKVFENLCQTAAAPMAAFLKLEDKYVLSASPERFLKKTGNTLIAQPMKGTVKRSSDKPKDAILKNQLQNSEKDKAENVMIVDLMRNDLTKSAQLGSITVDSLFEAQSFKGFHTLVSTISAVLKKDVSPVEAIKNAFPIGSMTGAPKVKVLEKIETYEKTKRGVYAGAIGYFSPNNDFDFNVVIRTLLYNSKKKYLSFHTGGAIVYDSTAKAEFEETELKALNLIKALSCKD